ncbi:MAG: hypothetical protein Q8922_14045 [Bacteroidota bacterium]|nr:hypothetical protein [Bacteroidota bacterium]MDP4233820.1 hypothetical protein [Bacteroidota bacterium]MDP4242481.1 hypothetical protein [Bacteroidota bacterium]MDP4289041.1 hypothetical protein [Bacteroidota bacterium]
MARKTDEKNQDKELRKKWNRIYRQLSEISFQLALIERYSEPLMIASVKGQTRISPKEEEILRRDNVNARQAAINARTEILSELVGETGISAGDKKRLLEATLFERDQYNFGKQLKVISELVRKVVLPNADPQLLELLDDE